MRGSTSGPHGTVRLSFQAGSCRALRRTLLALSALLLPALGPSAGEAEFPDPVRARLLADVTNVEAGRGFTLGVLLEQDPGWHTYWAWAGDAGQATEVAWQTPPGFDVAPLRWPGPHRYQEEDLTVFGYADEVMLLAPVRTPAVLPDTVRFTAEVSWLVCREICIPGGATLSLHLEAGEAAPAHAALFDRYRARVPAPLSEADPVSWRPTVEADGGALRVTVEVTAVHEGGRASFLLSPARRRHEPGCGRPRGAGAEADPLGAAHRALPGRAAAWRTGGRHRLPRGGGERAGSAPSGSTCARAVSTSSTRSSARPAAPRPCGDTC